MSPEQKPEWRVDMRTLVIVAANDAACEMFGYAAGELVGVSSRDIVALEEHARMDQVVQENLRGDGGIWKLRRKDGSCFWANTTRMKVVENDCLLAISSIGEGGFSDSEQTVREAYARSAPRRKIAAIRTA
jgi:PAS domain S-box-containing protein